MSRRFILNRIEDETGISGVGYVADGTQFRNGKCVLCWRTAYSSVAVYDDMVALQKIHGHDGKTVVEWIDPDVEIGGNMHVADILRITHEAENYMQGKKSDPNIYNVVNALDKLGYLQNIEQKSDERITDYPVYDPNHEFGDVGLCPRCRDVDIFPGQRVCNGCANELRDDV